MSTGPQVTFRPLAWTEKSTPYWQRRSRSTFKASLSNTLDLLRRELIHLDAKNVVIQAGLREQDIRLDGFPRSGAKTPDHPGVKIAFDSKHGPLTYATDTHEWWEHNIRAIALGLEALRAVDRYGVTKSGEQYRGWRQLPAGSSNGTSMSYEQALLTVAQLSAELPGHFAAGHDLARYRANPEEIQRDYRAAAKRHHPDRGGSTAAFQRLQEAKRVLDVTVA